MTFRMAIAGIAHETNTYCRDTTPLDDFRVARGERVLRNTGLATDVGGMLAAAADHNATVVPVLVAWAGPSGVIAADAYATLEEEILDGLAATGDLSAVALPLHGAGVVEGIDDLEAHLAERVRAVVGPDVVVSATFDLHGNVTQRMADSLDLLFGCHEYPHTDMPERGREAVDHIPRVLSGELRPVSWVETVPVLLPTNTTLFGVAKEVRDHCLSLESDQVIDCTFFHGFPYTDTPLVGAHITATANGDLDTARTAAQNAAAFLWERREAFIPESLTCEEAIERARAIDGGPVVINETSDNPGGGTPGDGTHLLRAMIEADLANACFGCIVDPVAAEAAHAAGVGATVELELGGRYDDLHGAPLPLTAYVKGLSDGRIRWQSMLAGVPFPLGPTARLQVGGIDIVVVSERTQTFDPEPFVLMGIDVSRYDYVGLKSSNHFRAGFQRLAAGIVTADPPGLTTHRLEIFPRQRAPGPLWPLDAATTYRAG